MACLFSSSSHDEDKEEIPLTSSHNQNVCAPYFAKRYILIIITFWGLVNAYSIRSVMNVAIVSMTENRTLVFNGAEQSVEPEFVWTKMQVGLVLSSRAYGNMVTNIPGAYLANYMGGKYILGGGVLLSGILILLTPVCSYVSVYLVVAMGVVEGMGQGPFYPSICATLRKWVPQSEKSRLTSIAFSGADVGVMVSMLISGTFTDYGIGWASSFYLFGCSAIIWFVLWCFLITEQPDQHSTITNEELAYIQDTDSYIVEERQNPPIIKILSSRAVWALVVVVFAENWGFTICLTLLPSYMKFALDYNLSNAGLWLACLYMEMTIVMVTSGVLADYLTNTFFMDNTFVRKLFVCSAMAGKAIFLIGACYCTVAVYAMMCIAMSLGLGGFVWGSIFANHIDIAHQYASVVIGMSTTLANIAAIISTLVSTSVVGNKYDREDWWEVFYMAAGVSLLGAVVFGFLGSGNRQTWAETSTNSVNNQSE